jgi:hypothetical protein
MIKYLGMKQVRKKMGSKHYVGVMEEGKTEKCRFSTFMEVHDLVHRLLEPFLSLVKVL